MSLPYIGEIRMFGGNFAPAGWAFCFGQLMPISENETLFNLIGTTYGGDGQATFALPNLQGRIPIHAGQGPGLSNYQLADIGGVESVTLTTNQIPGHNHGVGAAVGATGTSPAGAVPAKVTAGARYFAGTSSPVPMTNSGPTGGSQPHDNMAPFLCVSFIISLFGVFPSPT
jgi:microcystin-dependent protein